MLAHWRTVIALSATAMMGACEAPPEFTQPLSEPGEFQVDRRLVGTWCGVSYCEDVGGDGNPCRRVGGPPALLTMLHVSANGDGDQLQLRATAVAIALDDFQEEWRDGLAGRLLQLRATAHPATIDDITYYSVRREAGRGYDFTAFGEQPHYMIIQPELTDPDTLYLRLLWDVLEEERRVEAVPGTYFGYGIVEAPRERVIAALRAPDREDLLSPKFGPFRRVAAGFDTVGLRTTVCAPVEVRRAPRFLALAEVAKALAGLGLGQQALETARLALEMDAAGVRGGQQYAGPGLGVVAEAQALAGDLEAARSTVGRASQKQWDSWRNDPPALARALARLGQSSEAQMLAAALPFEHSRAETMREIAVILAQSGDREEAMQVARSAGRVSALVDVARVFRLQGEQMAAREMLGQAASLAGEDGRALLNVAQRQFEWGYGDAAHGTSRRAARAVDAGQPAGGITEAGLWRLRLQIAELQVNLEDVEGARASLAPLFDLLKDADLRQWPSESVKALPLDRLIALQLRLGDREEARRTFEQVVAFSEAHRRDLSRYDTTGRLALACAAIGDVPEAIEAARTLGAYMLYEVAATRRSAGDVAGARQILDLAFRCQQDEIRARPEAVVTDIEGRARAHREAGDDEAVDYFISLAMAQARAVEPPWHRVSLVLRVASLQEELGDSDGARETVLQALAMARDLPAVEPCSSVALLSLLALPDLDAEGER